MKIALIVLGYKPFRASGLDVAGERLVQLLLDAGHEVTVLAARSGIVNEVHDHPNLKIYRLPLDRSNWIGYSYKAARMIGKLNDSQPFDVVHFWDVHFSYAYRGGYVATLQMSFHQRQTMRKSPFLRMAYYYLAEYLTERPALRRAKGLLSTSLSTQGEYLNHYKITSDRIMLTRYGFDTLFFSPNDQGIKMRMKWGIGLEDPVILFAGFVTPRKGLEYLAQALSLIRPTPRLLMVGKWDESFRDQFMKLLGDQAHLLIEAGYVPDDEMPAYFSMADVFVSPTLLEGFGLPLAEALACARAVVASDVASVREVVGPGGLLVPPADPIALAQAISTLLQNKDQRVQLGEAGRAYICSEFDQTRMLNSTLAAYRRFLHLTT